MQFPGQGTPPIGIVFDADFGGAIDDVLALALLYGLEGKGEARLISTSTSRSSLRSAAFADALARFFAGPPPPAADGSTGFQRPVPPIGMPEDGRWNADSPVLAAVLDKHSADGSPVYPRGVRQVNDTADPAVLIRNALTAQVDQNSVVVLAGPAANLVRLLDLPGSIDIIRRKVNFLVVAADARLQADPASARRLFAEWPTPVVTAGAELGDTLPFPGSSLAQEFAWTPDHPVADAYRAFHALPYDAPAPALAAMLWAVHPDGYFRLSEPETPGGSRRQLIADPAAKDKVLQSYVALAGARPVPRQRFRRGQKKEAEAAPKPPVPAK